MLRSAGWPDRRPRWRFAAVRARRRRHRFPRRRQSCGASAVNRCSQLDVAPTHVVVGDRGSPIAAFSMWRWVVASRGPSQKPWRRYCATRSGDGGCVGAKRNSRRASCKQELLSRRRFGQVITDGGALVEQHRRERAEHDPSGSIPGSSNYGLYSFNEKCHAVGVKFCTTYRECAGRKWR